MKMRKTKAQLEVENKILRWKLQRTEDDKVIAVAHGEAQAMILSAGPLSGTRGNKKKAEERFFCFLEEYDAKQSAGVSPEEARDFANNELTTYEYKGKSLEKYKDEKDGRPNRRLKDLLKMYRPDDWP
jgi:hypothetical protein